MAKEHSSLTGSDLHEPKDADTANSGEVYRFDGVGGGSAKLAAAYGTMAFAANAGATVITTASVFTPVDSVSVWASSVLSNITFSGDNLITNTIGVYEVTANIAFKGLDSHVFGWDFGKTDSAITDSAIGALTTLYTLNSNVYHVSLTGHIAMDSGAIIKLMLRNETDSNDVTIEDAVVTMKLLSAT